MKLRGPLFFSALVVIFLMAAYLPQNVDQSEKEAVIMQTILGGLNQLHFDPKDIDDEFSSKVYDMYLDRLDGRRLWLTKSDIAKLKQYQLRIDDEMKASTYEFFDLSLELAAAGRAKAALFYKEILAQPFDFTVNEEHELDGEKTEFAANDKELEMYWKKSLKYSVMTRLADYIKKQDENLEKIAKGEEADEDFEEMTVEAMEAKAREKVLKDYDNYFSRLDKERRTDRLSNYLNAITNVYDPHTSYYEPAEKENFDISMSGTLEGIGARLQLDGDHTKIVSVVPGGPAWKGEQESKKMVDGEKLNYLEKDDLILKVAQGDDDPIDVVGWRLDDVVKKIRGKKGTIVNLTVRKIDNSTEVISIERDVVIMDEGYAKSAILNFPEAKNIGYIKLPRFYADFNRTTGRHCAEDIEKELNKLKDQNVNGIILDLRNNGGGSLRDVVDMTGFFIEEGPIVQVKARGKTPEILADEDPQVQYDGPLIVMVNKFSASASEILAAALQDYGRAVIVGSTSTYGKGTVQRFFDLDRAIRGNSEIKPLGQVKMTIQKFYRVNGGSTQLKGVTPDIILPDNYAYIETGERDQKFAMKWTEIDDIDYSQSVSKMKNISTLKSNSRARIAANDVFQKVNQNAKRLETQSEKTIYPLNLEAYQKMRAERDAESKKYKDIFEDIDGLTVANLAVDMSDIEIDESKKARNDEWLKDLKKDTYIEECLHIMTDMMK